jgi:hypothetical protein
MYEGEAMQSYHPVHDIHGTISVGLTAFFRDTRPIPFSIHPLISIF